MDIYIKGFNSTSTNPASFTLSSDIGSITPSTVLLNELQNGKIFSLSDANATQITFVAEGFQPKTITINKNINNCFQALAANYTQGNTRPTNLDGTIAPFRTEYIAAESVTNISNLDVGNQFSLQIFENLVELTIFNKFTSETNELIIQASGSNNEFFFLSKDISTNEIRFLYKKPSMTGSIRYSNTDSELKEWAPREFITIC
jgi:hypothetical protein